MIDSYNGMLPSNKKEQTIDKHSTMDEYQELNVKRRKADTKDHILYNTHCLMFCKRRNYRDRKKLVKR